ncbi:hypothetical protein [Mesoflavibacter sp. CH_XMU1422-2]|uniref:hypothetical protein n=1 Tax=Mesoflavibacter sp. CH_XMU1422-2 TaxID=3107770 RepID=UPI00300B92A6
MKEHNQNIIYKWTLRAKYIFVFAAGAGLLSFGLQTFFQPNLISKNPDLESILMVGSLLFGLIFIVFGFYYKKDIEIYIRQQQV